MNVTIFLTHQAIALSALLPTKFENKVEGGDASWEVTRPLGVKLKNTSDLKRIFENEIKFNIGIHIAEYSGKFTSDMLR